MMQVRPFSAERFRFLSLVALVQGGLMLVAVTAGSCMRIPPWKQCIWSSDAVTTGLVATIPMLTFFAFAFLSTSKNFRKIRQFVIDALGIALASCSYVELFVVAMIAGFTEEYFFRGVLEPSLGGWSPTAGLVVSNLLFAACHAVTPTYTVLAFLLGCYLSLSVRFTGEPNLVVPIVAHSLYDFVAFSIFRNAFRLSVNKTPQSDPSNQFGENSPNHAVSPVDSSSG